MNEPIVARHWLTTAAPKAAPAVATTTVLALARIWNANGAEHSVGNAALMAVLAAGAAAGGASLARAGEPLLAATGYAVSGSLALAGIAGYSDGLSLPLLLWALATVLAYCFAARHWRQDRRDALDHERHMSERREEHAHIERVETLRATTQIESDSPIASGWSAPTVARWVTESGFKSIKAARFAHRVRPGLGRACAPLSALLQPDWPPAPRAQHAAA